MVNSQPTMDSLTSPRQELSKMGLFTNYENNIPLSRLVVCLSLILIPGLSIAQASSDLLRVSSCVLLQNQNAFPNIFQPESIERRRLTRFRVGHEVSGIVDQ